MEFASLGSGSKGNATLVRDAETCLLIDCGFSLRQTLMRLSQLQLSPDQIDAVLVTHEHSDHISGVARFAEKYGLPVFMSRGTAGGRFDADGVDLRLIQGNAKFNFQSLTIESVVVPHDAREPCQYIISQADKQLGILTDTGCITDHLIARYKQCHGLIVEFNHDLEMLRNGDYPGFLKKRVAGDYGHLNNQQACDFLTEINNGQLKTVVAAHLSEKNNDAALVKDLVVSTLNSSQVEIEVLTQKRTLDWFQVG